MKMEKIWKIFSFHIVTVVLGTIVAIATSRGTMESRMSIACPAWTTSSDLAKAKNIAIFNIT